MSVLWAIVILVACAVLVAVLWGGNRRDERGPRGVSETTGTAFNKTLRFLSDVFNGNSYWR